MDADFWLNLWSQNRIPFHEGEANALLVAHFQALGLAPGARLLVPLCGKTRDIAWLVARGQRVAGAELSELAVRQLFGELGVAPEVTDLGRLRRFRAGSVEVWQGDIFDLTAELLGPVDAVYDRAALIALPPAMRQRYAAHLVTISRAAPQLVIGLEHDGPGGPPFSVDATEMTRLYADACRLTLLERAGGPGAASDTAWLLRESGWQ